MIQCDDESMKPGSISISGVNVRYRLPKQVTRSFKEYVVNRIKAGRYEYEEYHALKDINLQIQPGSSIGIIGRNGAGKSTLVKVLAGVIKPLEGTVSISGRIAPLIELGAGFDPELTGRENVYLNGTILGMTNNVLSEKMPGIIDFSELKDFLDAPLRTYSSGMLARLGFAIATDVDPDILVIDEILSVGDAPFQKKCGKRIEQFLNSGVTIILVSHSLDQVRAMCESVYWLEHGRIVDSGPTANVCDAYQKFYGFL